MAHVHPSAVLTGDIDLAPDAIIGPHCTLAGRIRLGAGTVLISSVHLHGPLEMGARNVCYPGVAVGFAPQDLKYDPSKDGGGTVIGDGNTFRECVSIHRATRDDRPTRVGNNNYLMANSHLGHDVQLGSNCILANSTLLAGHVEMADRVVTGGSAAIHQFVRIGRGAMVGGLAGCGKDLCPFFTLTAFNFVGGYNRIGMKRGGASAHEIDMVKTIYGILVRDRRAYSARIAALEKLAGDPTADEFIAFVRGSKRGLVTRHGRATAARGGAPAFAEE